MMRPVLPPALCALAFIALLGVGACQSPSPAPTAALSASDPSTRPIDHPEHWAQAISAFEAQDGASPPPQNAVVFVGSSSIVYWSSLAQDMAPLAVIQRGFGGSKIYEALFYADRIVWPYRPRAIVMFSGSNDLAEPEPKDAEAVVQGFVDFVVATRARLPDVDIHYISITPTRARWAMREQVEAANARIKAICDGDARLYFIDTAAATMRDGAPNDALFREDGLHLNAEGYAAWTGVIRPHLMALYGEHHSAVRR